jgi:hypothetical protein
MTSFHDYSNNTKMIYIIISVALLLIVVTTISPIGLSITKIIIGKMVALALLSYALVKNCSETNNLIGNEVDIFNNPDLSGVRNNALLSYVLCLSMLGLILYVIFTMFF